MLNLSALIAAVAVVLVGAIILWSNPGRWINRLVFSCSVHIALWLSCVHLALSALGQVHWLRLACAVSAWLPFHYWIVKESISGGLPRKVWRSYLIWGIVSAGLAVICYSKYFIPYDSSPYERIRGWGYYTYILSVVGLYAFVFFDGFRGLRTLTGGKRLELQVWLGGGCATALTILLLMGMNAVNHDIRFIRVQPIVVFLYYGITAFVITTSRIFNARQLVLLGVEKIGLVVAVSGFAYLVDKSLSEIIPDTLALFVTTATGLWFAITFSAWLDKKFEFYPQAITARQAAFVASQQETRIENLQKAFLAVLSGWGQTDHALLLYGPKANFHAVGGEFTTDSLVLSGMRQLQWATPERLIRERTSEERRAVATFLAARGIGALVIAEGPALTALIGVGIAASRRPFTYPQIVQLTELASIMGGALERAHFSAKVQHTEQLATVGLLGASLAHEIRNPLVTIKTFVQLLPKHHQDPAFREKFFRLIGDEVGRIDQLTEQLLDLASPRTYEAKVIELHPVLSASLDLVAAKAAHKNVRFVTDFKATPDNAFTDASAAKQVMLNLCFNAIQAAESHPSEDRWVRIATRNIGSGIEMAVADSGPGIAPEMRPKLFQPFQTTKSTGFGLGLAICSDILENLNASISVDPPEAGTGATFRVIFPCQPLSS